MQIMMDNQDGLALGLEILSEYVAEQYGVFSTGTRKTTPTYYLKMPAEKIEIVGS